MTKISKFFCKYFCTYSWWCTKFHCDAEISCSVNKQINLIFNETLHKSKIFKK